MAATIKGIDVSMYQTNVDFAKVKAAGYSFVIIRCNNWDNTKNCVVKDPLFETHYKNAKAADEEAARIRVVLQRFLMNNARARFPEVDTELITHVAQELVGHAVIVV